MFSIASFLSLSLPSIAFYLIFQGQNQWLTTSILSVLPFSNTAEKRKSWFFSGKRCFTWTEMYEILVPGEDLQAIEKEAGGAEYFFGVLCVPVISMTLSSLLIFYFR